MGHVVHLQAGVSEVSFAVGLVERKLHRRRTSRALSSAHVLTISSLLSLSLSLFVNCTAIATAAIMSAVSVLSRTSGRLYLRAFKTPALPALARYYASKSF